MNYNLKIIGSRIAQRRKSLNIHQKELAESLNISRGHLSNIENGKNPPGFELFLDICTKLKVNTDYITMGKVYADDDEEIIDKLKMCSDEYRIIISKIIDLFVELSNT